MAAKAHKKRNTDDTDKTDLHGFLVLAKFVCAFKSVFSRPIRVIRVSSTIRRTADSLK